MDNYEMITYIGKAKSLMKNTASLRQEALDLAIISFDDCPHYREGYADALKDDLEEIQRKYRKLSEKLEAFRPNPYIWQAQANMHDTQKAIALFTLRIKHLEKYKRSLTEEEWAALFLETREKAKQLVARYRLHS